jgi:hypothetical protein
VPTCWLRLEREREREIRDREKRARRKTEISGGPAAWQEIEAADRCAYAPLRRQQHRARVTDPPKQTPRTMEARPRLLLVAAVAVFVSVSAAAGAAVVINVKNYGAHGNGVNDDTKVGPGLINLFLRPRCVSAGTLIHDAAAADGSVEGSVRISWRGDDGRRAGDVLHRAGAVPRPLQGVHLDLPAAGTSSSVAHSFPW